MRKATQEDLGLAAGSLGGTFKAMNLTCPRTLLALTCCSLIAMSTPDDTAAQPRGYNYDEAKVPKYELPDPLVCLDGTKA